MKLEKLAEAYIESKKNSWSESTLRTAKSYFKGLTEEHLTNPAALYSYLKDVRELKPYSLKTTFVKVGELAQFALERGELAGPENKVKRYMKDNARLFKNVYQKKHLDVTFEEAAERIKQIEDEQSRAKAIELLFTGMRWAESQTLKDGQVVPKGGGTREVLLAKNAKHVQYEANYTTLYRHLKAVGLTPHMLRKLCATKVVELGGDVADLMKLFGWTNSNTAMLYVQAQKERELAAAMSKLIPKESTNGKQVPSKVSKARKRSAAAKR